MLSADLRDPTEARTTPPKATGRPTIRAIPVRLRSNEGLPARVSEDGVRWLLGMEPIREHAGVIVESDPTGGGVKPAAGGPKDVASSPNSVKAESYRTTFAKRPSNYELPGSLRLDGSSVGSTTRVHTRVSAIPRASSCPMLAIPRCLENARLPKLAKVVKEL